MATMTDISRDTSRDVVAKEPAAVVCNICLHQCFWLPETSSHGRLRVTFGTTSNFQDTDLPVLLFCGPMFSCRWMALDIDQLAADNNVRVICVDRPGMGGSTRVPLKLRIQVWLETVPPLLERLHVKHVSLFCHSTGAMYAMNTMYTLRDILDPQAPYVAFMTPWVSNKQPHTTLTKVLSNIPNGVLGHWNSTVKFITQHVSPVMSWSEGAITTIFSSPDSDKFSLADKYGTTEEIAKEINRIKLQYMFEEDTTGINEEARLCLRKEGPGSWGVCEDYSEFVRNLAELEEDKARKSPGQAPLEVKAYFASSDIMIGDDGQQYFEQCWRQPDVDKFITFDSQVLPGTSHDTVIIDPIKGALGRIFESFKGRNI